MPEGISPQLPPKQERPIQTNYLKPAGDATVPNKPIDHPCTLDAVAAAIHETGAEINSVAAKGKPPLKFTGEAKIKMHIKKDGTVGVMVVDTSGVKVNGKPLTTLQNVLFKNSISERMNASHTFSKKVEGSQIRPGMTITFTCSIAKPEE